MTEPLSLEELAAYEAQREDWLEVTPDALLRQSARHVLSRHQATIRALHGQVEELTKERDEYEADADHFNRLAFVDVGANPPVPWKRRAEAAEAKVAELTAKAKARDSRLAMLGTYEKAARTTIEQCRAEKTNLTKALYAVALEEADRKVAELETALAAWLQNWDDGDEPTKDIVLVTRAALQGQAQRGEG